MWWTSSTSRRKPPLLAIQLARLLSIWASTGRRLAVATLAALTANKVGFVPRLVHRRVLQSYHQFYNKRRAAWQAALGHEGTTARRERLSTKRTRRINHYLHAASKTIMALLVSAGIGALVMGNNLRWKQAGALGRVNNQHFVQLPHARFSDMLTDKAQSRRTWWALP